MEHFQKFFQVNKDGENIGVVYGFDGANSFVITAELPKTAKKFMEKVNFVFDNGAYVDSHSVYDEDSMIAYLENELDFDPETCKSTELSMDSKEDINLDFEDNARIAKSETKNKNIDGLSK